MVDKAMEIRAVEEEVLVGGDEGCARVHEHGS